MGLYGSPDVGNIYTAKVEPKPKKADGHEPQKNVWVWVTIGVMNLLIFLTAGKTLSNAITLIILDSIILFGISAVSFLVNLINKRKTERDVMFIAVSTLGFIIFAIILGFISKA